MSPDVPLRHAADHVHQLFYRELGWCDCGAIERAYELIRDLLILAPFYDDRRWEKATKLIGSKAACHIVLSDLQERGDLIEHGGAIGGSWLTDKGRYTQIAMMLLDWEEVDGAGGDPHPDRFPNRCDSTCWQDSTLLITWLNAQTEVRIDRFRNGAPEANTLTRVTHLPTGQVGVSGSKPLSAADADAEAARALLVALRRAEL